MADVLTRLKAYDSSIEQACVRSDNAGCYHCVSTLLSMPKISETSGITIRRMDFADPQGGKSKLFQPSGFSLTAGFIQDPVIALLQRSKAMSVAT